MITAQKILDLARSQQKQFEQHVYPLSEHGKIECLIYNALISYFSAQSSYAEAQLQEVVSDLFALLMGELELQLESASIDELGELVESRFALHTKDIVMILDGGAKHDPVNSYHSFYVSPLVDSPLLPVQEEKMAAFKTALVNMTNSTLEASDKLIDEMR